MVVVVSPARTEQGRRGREPATASGGRRFDSPMIRFGKRLQNNNNVRGKPVFGQAPPDREGESQ
jgi:hypothetical protein